MRWLALSVMLATLCTACSVDGGSADREQSNYGRIPPDAGPAPDAANCDDQDGGGGAPDAGLPSDGGSFPFPDAGLPSDGGSFPFPDAGYPTEDGGSGGEPDAACDPSP